MNLTKEIVIKLQVEGIHHWPECDVDGVEFLRHRHRHVFHLQCIKQVQHSDRDVEIIKLKRQMEDFLYESFATIEGQPRVCDFGTMSCEMIGELMVSAFKLRSCMVMEDDENGAVITDTRIDGHDATSCKYEDPSKKQRALWVGTEIEGALKGVETLFVNDITALPNEVEQPHVYFCPDVLQDTPDSLDMEIPILLSKGLKVTVAARPEMLSLISPYARVHCHIMVDIPLHGTGWLKPTDTIKVETDFYTTYSIAVKDTIHTKPEDYANDETQT